MDSRRSPQLWGVDLKHLSLVTLTLQNSALILIMHYSRVMPPVEGHRYFASTAVFLNEVIKLAISLTMALYDLSASAPSSLPATSLFKELMRLVFTGDSWKLAFPAILYTLQNSLQFLAVSNLNAATFQVTYQLKILFTAIFSVTMLGRSLSMKKWLSLLLLMVGVAIVQIPTEPDLPTLKDLRDGPSGFHFPRSLTGLADLANQARVHKRSATYEGIEEDFAMQHPQLDASLGLAAVVVACVLSGLAGVYFEKVLKDSDSQVSLWVRNVQLSFYSLYPALFVGVVFNDGAEIARDGFFVGYNWAVWTTIILQALGGVVVALVVNYADSIAKNIATSISIVVSLLASVYLFEFEVTNSYVLGTVIVLVATYLYSDPAQPQPPPITIANYEKTTIGNQDSYFDIQAEPLKSSKLSLRSEGRTTSRPATPTFERRHVSGGSFSKREEKES